jgi:hypothetical protein
MVKSKHIMAMLTLGLLISCACDHYVTEMSGLRSKRLYKKYIDEKINPQKIKISTKVLYKKIDYEFDEKTNIFSKTKDSTFLKNDIYQLKLGMLKMNKIGFIVVLVHI